MSSLLQDVKSRLAELGLQPKRSLGQNFLVNERVIEKILNSARSLRPQILIEVGPGLGALTRGLSREFKGRFLLVEMDHKFCEQWRAEGFEVHEADALKLDWDELHLDAPALLISNLPYQISSSLVIDRCLGPDSIESMILMFQKEVAQRIMARPHNKDYGLLSVMAQSFWKIEVVLEAGPRDFYPPPQVASRVLKFSRVSTALGLGSKDDRRGFLGLLKVAFAHRRKLLVSNLRQAKNLRWSHQDSWDQLDWDTLFHKMNIDIKSRAENLAPEQFMSLYERLLERDL